ncbi:MAG: hypothetical protein JW894_00950 [Bacteroidales bacterium]|nr:hypothetical protein [Bacteroidales bacterium]
MFRYFIFFIIIFIPLILKGQEDEKIRKNQIGAHAGFTTGMGLSYRFWPKK